MKSNIILIGTIVVSVLLLFSFFGCTETNTTNNNTNTQTNGSVENNTTTNGNATEAGNETIPQPPALPE